MHIVIQINRVSERRKSSGYETLVFRARIPSIKLLLVRNFVGNMDTLLKSAIKGQNRFLLQVKPFLFAKPNDISQLNSTFLCRNRMLFN